MALTVLSTSVAFTSCKEDTQPRLDKPSEFVLNTPPMADNTYQLSEDSGVELTLSQPNYGVGIVPTYHVEVATKADKSDARMLEEAYTSAAFTIPGESLSMVICNIMGYTSPELFSSAPLTLYLRAISDVSGHPEYQIASNWITLRSVVPYFAIKLPDNIYIVGDCFGWDVANTGYPLVETAVESRIYQGQYDIPAGKFQLRFYDEPGDWSSWSIGAQDEDNPVDISFTDGVYTGPAFLGGQGDEKGKGSWNVPGWPGGMVKFTVDLSNPKKAKVIFEII